MRSAEKSPEYKKGYEDGRNSRPMQKYVVHCGCDKKFLSVADWEAHVKDMPISANGMRGGIHKFTSSSDKVQNADYRQGWIDGDAVADESANSERW